MYNLTIFINFVLISSGKTKFSMASCVLLICLEVMLVRVSGAQCFYKRKRNLGDSFPPLNTTLIMAIVEVIMIRLYGSQQSCSLHTTSIAWLLMKAKESGKKSHNDITIITIFLGK